MAEDMAHVVAKPLPSKHKVQSSNPITAYLPQEKERRKEFHTKYGKDPMQI
jgi:hypothetical protein